MAEEKDINTLELVPVVNDTVGTIFLDNGLVTITYPRYTKKWQIKLLLPKGRENKIKLDFDDNGSAVWKLINGQRTVKEILDTLSDLGKDQEQFKSRVVMFLQSLIQNEFIRIK